MKLLLDMNLPRLVGRLLAANGHTWRHSGDLGLHAAADHEILALAKAEGEVMLPHNLDFGALLAVSGDDRQSRGPGGSRKGRAMSEELRAAILLYLDDRQREDRLRMIASDVDIAEELGVEVSEVQRQLDILENKGFTREANSSDGHNAWISPTGMEAADKLRPAAQSRALPKPVKTLNDGATRGPRLFISHSSSDRDLASGIAELLRLSLGLAANEIRCTSVAGFRLPVGASTADQLRQELLGAEAFIGVVSEASLRSTYVLFELGARWGAGLPLAPVLAPEASYQLLVGPRRAVCGTGRPGSRPPSVGRESRRGSQCETSVC